MMLDLADYRRRVHALYAFVRDESRPVEERWRYWIATRDDLFTSHPQTSLSPDQVAAFSGLYYYDYDPVYRFLVDFEPL